MNRDAQSSPNTDHSLATESLLLPPLNSHKRKLLYQEVSNRYPTLSLKELPEDNPSTGKIKRTRIFVTKQPSERIEPAVPEVCQHAGVRRVVEAILESKKPLVGFQTMGDVMYMLGGIYKELPRTLPEFLEMMKEVELLVDLKEVVEMEGLKEEDIRHCNLTHAYQQVEQGKKK